MSALATTLQAFFSDRLIRQRQVSSNTLQAYRDTLRLLLVFASERQGKSPVRLDIDDLDAPLIGAFLDHLEHERQNGVRTRNARLMRGPAPSAVLGMPCSCVCWLAWLITSTLPGSSRTRWLAPPCLARISMSRGAPSESMAMG